MKKIFKKFPLPYFIYSGEIRDDEIFISRNHCNNQCPAGPPGQKGSSGEKGEKGDFGVAQISRILTSTPTPKTAVESSLRTTNLPRFLPVGKFYCKSAPFHFATSYYSSSLSRTRQECHRYDCDIIIEWTKKSYHKTYTGYDFGKIDEHQSTCPHNKAMTAKIVWTKYGK